MHRLTSWLVDTALHTPGSRARLAHQTCPAVAARVVLCRLEGPGPHHPFASAISQSLRSREDTDTHAALRALGAARITALTAGTLALLHAPPAALRTSLTRLDIGRAPSEPQLLGFAGDAALRQLTALRHLSPQRCGLRAVPPAVLDLTGLTYLGLGSYLPLQADGIENLRNLRQLRHLEVGIRPSRGSDQVAALTVSLPAAAAVTGLVIATSGAQAADWRPLRGWRQVEALNVFRCGLTSLPAAVAEMSALRTLVLRDNNLGDGSAFAALSEVSDPLPRLQQLDISSCRLMQLPPQLSRLPGLTGLLLAGNFSLHHESRGWSALRALASLARLSLSGCNLAAVPEPLSCLTALTELDLGTNPLAGGWQVRPTSSTSGAAAAQAVHHAQCNCATVSSRLTPQGSHLRAPTQSQHLRTLRQLERAHFSSWEAARLPDAFSTLTALRTLLVLHGGTMPLTGGGEVLLQLTNLRSLALENNALTGIPAAMSRLQLLTALALRGNHLIRGMEHLQHLRALRRLKMPAPEDIDSRLLPDGIEKVEYEMDGPLRQSLWIDGLHVWRRPSTLQQPAIWDDY